MRRSRPSVAKAKGVFAALAKRGIFFLLGVLILQLVSLQLSVVNGGAQQQKQAQERLQEALRENEREHRKTQSYVKCLVAIILVPIEKRPSNPQTALDKCGATDKAQAVSARTRSQSQQSTTALAQPSTAKTSQPTTGAPPDNSRSSSASTVNPQPALALGQLIQPTFNVLDMATNGVKP